MIITELKVINLFLELDDFVIAFDKKIAEHLLENRSGTR